MPEQLQSGNMSQFRFKQFMHKVLQKEKINMNYLL